jgi:hypothetical protein
MMVDIRAVLSDKLKELANGATDVWVTWPYPHTRMRLSNTARPAKQDKTAQEWVLFVHKGRFGVGYFFDKNGPHVGGCKWVDGRSGPDQLYVHDIRADIVEAHPEFSPWR